MQPVAPSPSILLPASLDLAAAEGLYRDLAAGLNEGDITLDGAAVERIGTPCLQVLAAASASARRHKRPFRLLQASAVLRDAIADLGLAALLPCEG